MVESNMFHSAFEAQKIIEQTKRLGKANRRMRPGPECRAEAVELIAWGIEKTLAEDVVFNYAREIDRIRDSLDAPLAKLGPNVFAYQGADVSASFAYFSAVGELFPSWYRQDESAFRDPLLHFREAEALLALGLCFRAIDQVRNNEPWSRAVGDLSDYVLHARACAQGAEPYARWVGGWLFNALQDQAELYEVEVGEKDFTEFYWVLVAAQMRNQWPDPERLADPALGVYAPLLQSVTSPGTFEDALLTYLDHRLARAYGYLHAGDSRPKPDGKLPNFMPQRQWYAIWPFELWTLQAVVRQCLGIELNLLVDHPLVKTPLMTHPIPFCPLADTPLTRQMKSVGKEVFGELWKPFEPIAIQN